MTYQEALAYLEQAPHSVLSLALNELQLLWEAPWESRKRTIKLFHVTGPEW